MRLYVSLSSHHLSYAENFLKYSFHFIFLFQSTYHRHTKDKGHTVKSPTDHSRHPQSTSTSTSPKSISTQPSHGRPGTLPSLREIIDGRGVCSARVVKKKRPDSTTPRAAAACEVHSEVVRPPHAAAVATAAHKVRSRRSTSPSARRSSTSPSTPTRASESSSPAAAKACSPFLSFSLPSTFFSHPTDERMDSNALHRTVTGVLKGYDQLFNLVLDEVEEQVQGTHR